MYPQCSMISALARGSLQNAKIASWVVRAPSWVVREPSWVVICNFCPVPRVPSTLRCCQTVQKKPVISTGKNCKHGALRRGLIPHWGPLQCLRIPIYVPWQGESTFFRKTRGPVVERWERLSFWDVSLWHEVPLSTGTIPAQPPRSLWRAVKSKRMRPFAKISLSGAGQRSSP